jgi:hypothetical protein
MPGISKLVVPEKSVVLKADFKCPIEGTHTSMTRFYGPDDPEYLKVKSQLTSWLSAEAASRDARSKGKGRDERKEKKNRQNSGVSMVGPSFNSVKGDVYAPQQSAKHSMYIVQGKKNQQKFYGGDKSSSSEESPEEDTDSDSEDEDEGEDEQGRN